MITPQQNALRLIMESLSEIYYNAGWHDGIEYILWSHVVGDYADPFIDPFTIESLKWLSEQCSGWWVTNERDEQEFISMEQWLVIYGKV